MFHSYKRKKKKISSSEQVVTMGSSSGSNYGAPNNNDSSKNWSRTTAVGGGKSSPKNKWVKPTKGRKTLGRRYHRRNYNNSSIIVTMAISCALVSSLLVLIVWAYKAHEQHTNTTVLYNNVNVNNNKKKNIPAIISKETEKKSVRASFDDDGMKGENNKVTTKDKNKEEDTTTSSSTSNKFVYVNIPPQVTGNEVIMAKMEKKGVVYSYHPKECSIQNIPKQNFENGRSPYDDGREMFTIVRHPYDRLIQLYHDACNTKFEFVRTIIPKLFLPNQSVEECQNSRSQMNMFIRRILTLLNKDNDNSTMASSDCSFYPQSDYTNTMKPEYIFCSVETFRAFKHTISDTSFDHFPEFNHSLLNLDAKVAIKRNYQSDINLCREEFKK